MQKDNNAMHNENLQQTDIWTAEQISALRANQESSPRELPEDIASRHDKEHNSTNWMIDPITEMYSRDNG